jgi:hypothetical protein
MANAKDVAAVIQSALDEIGVTGQLAVSIYGQEVTSSIGLPGAATSMSASLWRTVQGRRASHRRTESDLSLLL